jgi:peptidoglycan/LPS O-acetylase OafA/YrhL
LETHQIGHDSPTKDRLPELRALTGLRGVAATTVALAHFMQFFPNGVEANSPFMWHNAVDLFFCLSGFTLSYVYSREGFQFSSYLTARIARIYPLYFVTLIIAGAAWVLPLFVNPTTYPAGSALSDFLLQVFMINSWPVIGSGVHWNITAWSISVEWFCYVLLFPFLLVQKRLLRSPRIMLLCIVVLSAFSYLLFLRYFDGNLSNPAIYVPKSQWSYWVSLLRGVCGFTAGWIVFASFERRDDLYALCTRFSTLIWSCVVCIVFLGYRLINAQALVFLFPFVVLAATDPASATSRLLGSRALHFLGVISYSIYMVHSFVLILFIAVFRTPWTGSLLALLVGTTFVVSAGTYFAIEVPARNAIRGIQRTRPAQLTS